MVKCEICDITYNSLGSLSNHIKYTHKIDSHTYFDTYLKKGNDGICPMCGKPTTFLGLGKGYRRYCSKKCASIDPIIIKKTQNTCIERYGMAVPMNQEKYQSKAKLTNLEKYGVEQPLSSPIVRQKIINTTKERYGVNNVFASDECKQKIKETMLQRYGVDNAIHITGNLEKLNSKEAITKMLETKRKNGTFKTSKPEEDAYILLMDKFEKNNIKRQYKSELYPYLCDFYIKSADLYIELNLHWTHGSHWFDENNPKDIDILRNWEEKAKHSTYYQYAIDTWTKRDVKKRQIAKQNTIKYLVFWKYDDFLDWISQDYILFNNERI